MVSGLSIALLAGLAAALVSLAALRAVPRAGRQLRVRAERLAEGELADAFIFVEARTLQRASAAVSLGLALGASLAGFGAAGAFAAMLTGLAAPQLLFRLLQRRRRRQLVRQLPDAMQALASLLQSGNALPQAIARLAETQPRPLRDEWRLLLRGLRMGERPDAAFEQLATRIPAPEARLLATTVRVALDLGGSLSEALLRLADSTRRRLDMLERIRALTAQGRLQGFIVGALPLLMLVVLQAMDGAAMGLLWTTPGGWAALAVLVALETCGFVLIRRIVRIDV